MPSLKGACQNFAKETSFHGFRRLWIGNSRFRWPFWAIILLFCITASIYQIGNKLGILIRNPLSVNINLAYHERIEFPTITVCNKLKVRVSFIVNNTAFLNMFHVIFPHIKKYNFSDINDDELKTLNKEWSSKKFFQTAGIPKEDLILWCIMPNGEKCSSDDFVPIITNDGVCYKLNKVQEIVDAGHGNGLKVLLNLAEYERLPDTDSSSGIRLIIHNNNEEPIPSKGYDVMPGYQVAIVLRKHKHTQLYNCEADNPLIYYANYSYSACKIENSLVEAMDICKCRPYILPELVNEENYKSKNKKASKRKRDCSIMEHYNCIEKNIKENVQTNKTHVIKGGPTPCFVECVREEYEKEIYYNVFREDFAYKKMLTDKANQTRAVYQLGRDAVAFLNFYKQLDPDYLNLLHSSWGFKKFVALKKLMPPFGTVWSAMMEKLTCLGDIVDTFGTKNATDRLSLLKLLNTTLIGALVKGVINLEPKLDSLEISDSLAFARQLHERHSDRCSNRDKDICSLGALYDLLTLRTQLVEKNAKIKRLLNEEVKNFTSLVETFVKEDDSLLRVYKNNYDSEKKLLKINLELYLDRITGCLRQIGDIFDDLLNNGQPSMSNFVEFFKNLHKIERILTHVCRGDAAFAAEPQRSNVFTAGLSLNRRELAEKIVQLLTNSEVNTVKSVKFNNVLIDMAEFARDKLPAIDIDLTLLNESLYNMEVMDQLLNKYVNQTTQEVFKKSELSFDLYISNPPFQRGVKTYSTLIKNHFNSLDIFLQTYMEKLKEVYPGAVDELNQLTSLGLDILANLNTNETEKTSDLDTLICLKKARMFLGNVATTDAVTTDLELYGKNVDNLVSILKLYVDDIGSLKGFYRENLGYVKIYLRDMGVQESVQEHAYDFLSFLCDMGGIIGLWLGGSVLSLFETADLLLIENLKNKFRFYRKLTRLKAMNQHRRNTRYSPPNGELPNSDEISSSMYTSCRESFQDV